MPSNEELISKLNSQVLFDLASIHSFVVSRETTKSIQSYTFEHYLQLAKDLIKSDATNGRPTKLTRLERLNDLLNSTIEKVKQFNKEQKEQVSNT